MPFGNKPKNQKRKKPFWREAITTLLWALALSLILRAGVVEAYHVPTGSMEPTILVGDQFLVSKSHYGIKLPFSGKVLLPLGQPQRGDIVVFKNPDGRGDDFVKRVIALPGEVVEVCGPRIFINGKRLRDPWGRFTARGTGSFGPVKVPPKHYFVMGDNRDNSYDSRYWNHGKGGFVPENEIRGKVLLVLFSLDHQKMLPRLNRFVKLLD